MKLEKDRFFNKVDTTQECWLWKGTTYRGGYGHFRRKINNKWVMYKAHRFSYELHNGSIPKGNVIRHSCDNPSCVNPEHLKVGTQKENIQDAILRNRIVLGRNPKHLWLSLEVANHFRNFAKNNPTMKQKDMAKILNTSTAQLSRILSNKIWKEEN